MSELRDRELRDLLERVSMVDGDVDVDEHWVAGRRRRTRRGAGIVIAAGVAAVMAVGAVAQTGLMGGSRTTPTGPAAVPDALETFVFAAEDATGALDETAELHVPEPADLSGTSWVLQGQMWNDSTVATDLTGTTAPTALTFGDDASGAGWGVSVGGCGSAGVSRLVLDERGRFAAADPNTTDVGCAEDVQAAEDFWIESLSGGGQLTLLGDGQWLLLSVDAPAPPTPTATTDPLPSATTEPAEDEDPTDDGTAAPGEGTTAPTGEGTTSPSTAPSPPPSTTPSPSPGPSSSPSPSPSSSTDAGTGAPPLTPPSVPDEPFTAPEQESVDGPWPGGSGQLFAPTVRAGVHEGFDRVVVDLSGTGDLGWRAAYTEDPRLDGSGFPSDIAGDSVLAISLAGMAYPEAGSDVYSEGTFGLDTHTLDAVIEVQRTTPFEGMLQVFVGMQGEPRPYRVFLLQDPMRLVIDVQTAP